MGQKASAIVKNHFKDKEPPCFLSMGIVMLHEIHYPYRLVRYDVPGGAGLYGTKSVFSDEAPRDSSFRRSDTHRTLC